MKSGIKTITEKTNITSLLRPVEGIIGEMISLSEMLAEIEIMREDEENNLR